MVTLARMHEVLWAHVRWLLPCLASLGCGKIIGIEQVTQDAGRDVEIEDTSPVVLDTKPAEDVPPTILDDCESTGAVLGTYRETLLADHPIGYWPLDDEPGSKRAIDVHADTDLHHADALGVTFGVSRPFGTKPNNAARFDGAAFLTLRSNYDFGDRSFSIEAWFQPAAIDFGDYRFVFAKATEAPRTGVNFAYAIEGAGFERWISGEIIGGAGMAIERIELGKWMHLVARYDSIQRRSTLVIDGKIASTRVDTSGFTGDVSNDAFFTWGKGSSVGGAPMNGALFDELAIYDYVVPCQRLRAHLAAAAGE